MKSFTIGNPSLRVVDFLQASRIKTKITIDLDRSAIENMQRSRRYVESLCHKAKPVYGVNTGFGSLANIRIQPKDIDTLQLNFIRSHCVGVGKPMSLRETRLLMLLRAHMLALGYSGVRTEVVERMIDFLNHEIYPVIPEEGSVGASGDLAPMAHLSLALIGEGLVFYQGQKLKAHAVLKELNLKPLALRAKEGLALTNGTQQMLTYGLLALARAARIAKLADIISSCSLECVRGTSRPFDVRIHNLRPHPGQKAVSENVRRLLRNSKIMESHTDCDRVQDPYSFRCIPQVHGAARDLISMASVVIQRELHAITDNPIVFADEDVISAGNFHGAPLAHALDIMAIAIAEFGALSERRIDKLTNPHFSDLSAFLTKNPGLNSGVMISQYTAAALASENKILCHPASIDSIPTSNDKEDHVSMGPIAGRKLKKVLLNTERILSIEALCARQGLWHLEPLKPGQGVMLAYEKFSRIMPPIENDRVLAEDVANMHQLLFASPFLQEFQEHFGELT